METAEGRALWLKERRSGIGGTDIPAILGLSRYSSEMDVWLEKRGEAPPRPDTEPMYWGRALEPVIAQRYAETTGRTLWNPRQIFRYAGNPILMSTPDRLVVGERRGFEAKTAHISKAHEWGEPGTDDVPPEYIVQCCHYMLVHDFPVWDLGVLIGGSDFRIYTIRRDADLQDTIRERALAWWEKFIVGGATPPISGTPGVSAYLARKFPRESAPMLKASAEAMGIAERLRQGRYLVETGEEMKAAAENALKALIGEAEGIAGDDWRVTWRATQDRTTRDWSKFLGEIVEAVAANLGNWSSDAAVNREFAEKLVNKVLDDSTVKTPGGRRFVFTTTRGKA